MKKLSCLTLALMCLGLSADAFAQEKAPITVGARIGGNYNYLTRPTDPKGEPTLLYGSAYAGFGFAAGLELNYPVTDSFMATFGLIYGRHNGTGYAKNEARQQEQSLTLSAHTIHLPILLTWVKSLGALKLMAGIGPELLFTVASASTTTYTNIDASPQSLETFNPLHVGVTTSVGLSAMVSNIELPLIFRFTWDPMMPGSTRERLINYKNLNDLGQYQVAFDWQFSLLFGANFSL